jgi:hypothetical protein
MSSLRKKIRSNSQLAQKRLEEDEARQLDEETRKLQRDLRMNALGAGGADAVKKIVTNVTHKWSDRLGETKDPATSRRMLEAAQARDPELKYLADTPYGSYRPSDKTLITTGNVGTTAHELGHHSIHRIPVVGSTIALASILNRLDAGIPVGALGRYFGEKDGFVDKYAPYLAYAPLLAHELGANLVGLHHVHQSGASEEIKSNARKKLLASALGYAGHLGAKAVRDDFLTRPVRYIRDLRDREKQKEEAAKEADHAGDRFEERLRGVDPALLQKARDRANSIPPGPETRMHAPLEENGKLVGYAAYKRVGNDKKPVLATILGPNMTPRKSHLLSAEKIAAGPSPLPPEEVEQARETGRKLYNAASSGGLQPGEYVRREWVLPDGTTRPAPLLSPGDYVRPMEQSDAFRQYSALLEKDLGVELTPEKIKALLQARDFSPPAPKANAGVAVQGLHGALNPGEAKELKKRLGEGELSDLLSKLPETSAEERPALINQILKKDVEIDNKRFKEHGKALLGWGPHGSLGAKAKGGLALAGALGLGTTNLWAPTAIRKAIAMKNLSEEEKQLSPEEKDRILAERSPFYRQLLQKNDTSSDINAGDVLALGSAPINMAQLKYLDAVTGRQGSQALDLKKGLSEMVGAQIFHHGTSPSAIEGIKRRGLDPGFGGAPSGFTFKATHRQALRSLGDGLRGSDRDRRDALQVLLGSSDRHNQPSVQLSDGEILPLDTSKFLSNAKGGLFVTKDLQAARNYASSQNPEMMSKRVSDLMQQATDINDALYPTAGPGKGMEAGNRHRILNVADEVLGGKKVQPWELQEFARTHFPELGDNATDAQIQAAIREKGKEHWDGARKALPERKMLSWNFLKRIPKGLKTVADLQKHRGYDPENPNLFTGVMPIEEMNQRFELDPDDVNQGGTALRLKKEHRVTPYAAGQVPDSPTGYHVPLENLEQGESVGYGKILKNRTKDLGKYIRGEEGDRTLGLNTRFVKGVGRSAANLGLHGALAYSAVAPLGKKLYRKYKEHQEGVTPEQPADLAEAEPKTAAPRTRLFAGLRVRVDRPKGFVQKGKDASGKPWERTYLCDYGYLAGTQGGDGDGLDVFLGPDEKGSAFLILQVDDKGAFDEFKLMLGFKDAASARSMYLKHVPEKYMGKLKEVPLGLLQGLTGRPVDHSKVASVALWTTFENALGLA